MARWSTTAQRVGWTWRRSSADVLLGSLDVAPFAERQLLGCAVMVEYSSVSASSYDPASLVAKLNASAGEGWEVVSIVPTGGDVTAFLRRSGATDADSGDGAGAEHDAEVVELVTGEPPVEAAGTSAAVGTGVAVGDLVDATPTGTPAPVEEPAGWAVAPTPEAPAEPTPDVGVSEPDIPTAPDVVTPEPVSEPGPEPDIAPAAEPAPEPAAEAVAAEAPSAEAAPESPSPAAAPVVTTPAGWYPDPSNRFEPRYWDGTQWTEHVATGGRQDKDPPVA
jgi:hypothetical protein